MSLITTLRLALISLAIATASLLATPVLAATVSYQFPWSDEPFVLDCSTLDYANPFNNFTEPDVDFSLWEVDPVTANIYLTDCIAAQANEQNPTSTDNHSGEATNQNTTSTTTAIGGQGGGTQVQATPAVASATTNNLPTELPRTGAEGFGFLLASLLGSGGGIASYLRTKHAHERQTIKQR